MSFLSALSEMSVRRQMEDKVGVHRPPNGAHRAVNSAARSYRPEIDGLRAVAVSAVIAEHFSSSLLPGGYLGVDLFFVISGFVISSSLAAQTHLPLKEYLIGFYVRRIKRLLPALVLCVLTTAIFAALFFDADTREYPTIIMSGAWALLGASNVYFFARATDYFATSSELNPFSHTWSLGVEEQFYLVYPAMLLLGSAGARRGAEILSTAGFALLVALSMIGFLLLLKPWPSASYFLAPLRFWELGIGCLTYFFCSDPKRAATLQREWIALLAAALIGASFCLPPVSWQGAATVLAVASTAIFIAALRPGLSPCSVLSLSPIVWVGLISYSLYLWHWSVLTIARWTIGVSLGTAPFLVALMFALAAGSYLFVERPLRYRTWSPCGLRTIGCGIGVSVAAFACLLALRFPLRGEFYTGAPAEFTQANTDLLTEHAADGTLLWRAPRCVLSSNNEVGKVFELNMCLLGGERLPHR